MNSVDSFTFWNSLLFIVLHCTFHLWNNFLREDSETAWASTEVLLRTEGDEQDRCEALEAAKAMLEAEGFPEGLLQDHESMTDDLWLCP